MKRIVLAILTVAVLTGCGGKKPIPASRLKQPAGDFSFVTPDGWFRTKLAGIDFIIVSAEPDFGSKPNLFVDSVEPDSVSNKTQEVIERYQDDKRSYEVAHRSDFATESGLTGIKITASRETKDALPLATFHYLVQDGERVIVITATCADPVKQKYEPIFDAAMKTLQSERTNQRIDPYLRKAADGLPENGHSDRWHGERTCLLVVLRAGVLTEIGSAGIGDGESAIMIGERESFPHR